MDRNYDCKLDLVTDAARAPSVNMPGLRAAPEGTQHFYSDSVICDIKHSLNVESANHLIVDARTTVQHRETVGSQLYLFSDTD